MLGPQLPVLTRNISYTNAHNGESRSTMKFVLFLCLASAAALGVLAAKLETEESQYYFSAPNQGDDRSSETETKTDNEDGSEMIEEDDVKPPTPVKIQPKKKKKTTCTCPKTTAETTPTEPTMTWEALEELLDDIRDIGPVSGTLFHSSYF